MKRFNCLSNIAALILATVSATAFADDARLSGAQLQDCVVTPKGVFVARVAPGSAAADTGLIAGDVITGVNGQAVAGKDAFLTVLSGKHDGDTVTLRVSHFGGLSTSDMLLKLTDMAQVSAPAAPAHSETPVMAQTAAPANVAPTPAHPKASVHMVNAVASPSSTHWVRFADPSEHAFTLDVPAGWRVYGGSKRMNAVEIRTGVDVVSPDGSIHLFYNDLNVPIFTTPSMMFMRGGLFPGMTYSPGQNVHMLIKPYMNGEAFAARWGMPRMARNNCTGVSRTSSQARPDSGSAIGAAYAQGGIRTSIKAGEASFSCSMNGEAAKGYVFAATELVQSRMTSMWDVKSLVGYTATAPRAAEASALLSHMVASFAIDRNWMSRQQQIAGQFDRVVAQTNAAVSNAIAQNGRIQAQAASNTRTAQSSNPVGDMIVQGGKSRSDATSAAIDGYDQNAVRSAGNFVNTSTGATASNVDLSYSNHYMNNQGQVLNTNSENAPGADWEQMQRVPPGQ